MDSDLVFLDTNVFMYAAGAPHPLKESCIQVLRGLGRGALRAAINVEVLQELLYRYHYLHVPEKGLELCRAVLRYPLEVWPVTPGDMHLAIELYAVLRSRGIEPRDADHAATMQTHGVTRLISTDRVFDHVDFLVRLDPSTVVVQGDSQ